ncbi:MAG: protein kinase, partial [Myxococcales bacterium]|nr:protein kinase [Myxococcales bacterium]
MTCQHCGAQNAVDARFCGVCGRATSATEPSRAGDLPAAAIAAPDLSGREIAGRYRILAKLGEGGMGAVYRGEQISLKRKCAIKLLRPELSADPGLVRRFNAEAELVAKLSHPNTVNIYDFGQDADGTLFIAMEYLEGRSLRQAIMTEGPLPPSRALHVAAQIAASLGDAHAHGIVHRDLKPDNVMLTARGREHDVVRVLDFGIAKVRDEQNKVTVNPMTQAGDLVGTPQYMAPEQIRGEHVDGRTDVYALGAIVYEMITGRLPFEGPSLMAILSRHLMDPPVPPTQRRPDLAIPPVIDALVMELLAKAPDARPASMEVVTERLAHVAHAIGAPSAVMVAPWG